MNSSNQNSNSKKGMIIPQNNDYENQLKIQAFCEANQAKNHIKRIRIDDRLSR